ncbi:DUF3592 domain-containing protein [Microbulbifer aggregans]|uniref:DUF3592 domain-containing protein n=1 Tax=Microbulbifer aggregans TaxID=1769779 RepID=UPI001CFF4A44|nr:DUF3592 domain-containing protein [Microbulbifer aggregans]
MFGPIMIICISLILFFVLLQNAKKCFESKRWPTVRGKIVYNKVNTVETTTGSDGLGGNARVPVSTLTVEYRYKVLGKAYKCSTLKFLRGESNNYFVEKLIGKKYPVGKVVTVHYNARNPEEP